MSVDLRHGDSLDVLPTLADGSVSAIVTDPPYGLSFMGRSWDDSVPVDIWAECLRVLRPGGHLLAFGGTRTFHRLAVAIEDAGFEIRDTITWLYSQGFPKSRDVGKAIDKAAGAEREVVGFDAAKRAQAGSPPDYAARDGSWAHTSNGTRNVWDVDKAAQITAPATATARQWQGWGTALKPASEPIIVARKPLAGTVAANVLAHGTGALNIDATRVQGVVGHRSSGGFNGSPIYGDSAGVTDRTYGQGRWPANVVLTHVGFGTDGVEEIPANGCTPGCPVAELDAQSGNRPSTGKPGRPAKAATYSDTGGYGGALGLNVQGPLYSDAGGASRFFPVFRYQAKAPASERPKIDGQGWPTVKPLALMRWLVRLVTPPGGLVLDPFAGTGPTLQAAELEGFDSLGIERDDFAYRLACQRLGIEAVA